MSADEDYHVCLGFRYECEGTEPVNDIREELCLELT